VLPVSLNCPFLIALSVFSNRPWAEIAYRAPSPPPPLQTSLIFACPLICPFEKKHVNIEYFGTNLHFLALFYILSTILPDFQIFSFFTVAEVL
jgi:hypothetical protein